MRRLAFPVLLALCIASAAPSASASAARTTPSPPPKTADAPSSAVPWAHRIDLLVRGRAISVVVGNDDVSYYRHKPLVARQPASNEKLLVSMALMDALGPGYRITTSAEAGSFDGNVVHGDLWIIGGGDPEIGPARMGALARNLADAGVTRIEGSVRGDTSAFLRDWWAQGWKSYFPDSYVALPTALAFQHNTVNGRHIRDPERRAAVSLTKQLRSRGIRVTGRPRAGKAPGGLASLAGVESAPLETILRRQNVPSDNWYAETMGKLLGATVEGGKGSIAKGAKAIDGFAASHEGGAVAPLDSSGLSYDDRVTSDAMVALLWWCDTQTWADDLRAALPAGGQGTLSNRLKGVKVRAKTGTLTGVSALSGWVRSERSGEWLEFSILSKGMPKSTASHIEDRIVTIVANSVA